MDRSYAAVVGDLMWFAPIEVITDDEGGHAALAPGHEMRAGTRFTTPIVAECLACHTDSLPPESYPLNLRPDPAVWQPSGISCDACHGDDQAHVEWRERAQQDPDGARAGGKDPILSASRLGPIESISVCARCHLQGDGSILLDPDARGIVPPGGDMLDRRAVFVGAKSSDEIRFVGHVERLLRSRCYSGSMKPGREPMTCVTCHDPHKSSFDPAERRVVRDACSQCHASEEMGCSLPHEQRGGKDCVDCHMRRTSVFDVGHVEIHDHFIRKVPGPPSPKAPLRVQESKEGAFAIFAWPGREPPPYVQDPGLWMMAEMGTGHPDLALPFADMEPGPASARLPMYHHMRGLVFEAAGRMEDARAAYQRALELDPNLAESSVNLGFVLGKLGMQRESIAVLDKAIAKYPSAWTALRNRGVMQLQLGDADACAADLERAFAIAPDAAVAIALAGHYKESGRTEEAERWTQEAIRLDPSRAAAWR
jgi:predicted CXXCH cytochrome family protein